MSFPVFFDTCVLYGATLNDTILRLAEARAFRPLWSQDVLEELHRNLAVIETVGPQGASHRLAAMRAAFPEAIISDYEQLIPSMTCDPKDRHVLAAAVRSGCEVLVTFNLRDFPADSVAQFELVVRDPDEFLLDQLDLYPAKVASALRAQVSESARPSLTLAQLLGILSRSGVPRFAAEAMRHDFEGLDW